MGRIRPLGAVLGLVGNALLAVAVFKLLETGSCGDVGTPACPDLRLSGALTDEEFSAAKDRILKTMGR